MFLAVSKFIPNLAASKTPKASALVLPLKFIKICPLTLDISPNILD